MQESISLNLLLVKMLDFKNKNKKLFATYLLDRISAHFPNAKIGLCFNKNDPWQLFVAVILSAQSMDVKVNNVTPKLFESFVDVYAFSKATANQIEPYIKILGLFRNKSKNLVKSAKIIVKNYNGILPKKRSQLESLPGVGPKSAAVIIASVFGQQAIAVDTHVKRVTQRLGLTAQINPNKIEDELNKLFDNSRLLEAHHSLIWHGRKICKARRPKCSECPVEQKCPKLINNL